MSAHNSQHPITSRHRTAFSHRPAHVSLAMDSLAAITWTPGGYHTSFLGRMFRPIGAATMVAMFSRPGFDHHVVHLHGYTAEIGQNGYLIGGAPRNVFAYDFAEVPRFDAPNHVINPRRNPALGFLGLEMDGVRRKVIRNKLEPDDYLVAPMVYLGFRQDSVPDMEDTPMLRARVARNMQRHVGEIDQMSTDARNVFMAEEWPRCVIPPGKDGNDTRLFLLNADLCPSAVSWADQIFERFDELCGAELYNPAKYLLKPERAVRNPAKKVAQALSIKLPLSDGLVDGVDQGMILAKGMREALGPDSHLVSEDDLVLMALDPNQTYFVPEGVRDLAELSDDTLVSLMRHVGGRYAEACTDQDLLYAGRHPNQPLYASGLCSIQVLRVDPAALQQSLWFGPERMGNRRITIDAFSIREGWRDTWAGI